jgi:ABC-type glutathione transport system ATPase component
VNTTTETIPALEARDVTVSIQAHGGRGRITPVRGASITVHRGEMVGLVGESGSGKTMFSRAVAGLLPPGLKPQVGGSYRVSGKELAGAGAERRRLALREDISYVFQDPNAHLNPTMRIGAQVREAIRGPGGSVLQHFEAVGLPATKEFASRYPHQLSGGMRQRVIIAIALAKQPSLIVADEPTTALDVTVQDQVLRLLRSLTTDTGVGILLVSHDLAAVAQFCSRIYVMYDGELVESGPTEDVLWRSQHEYTKRLTAAMRTLYNAPIRGARTGEQR